MLHFVPANAYGRGVAALDDPHQLLAGIPALGKHHASYGVEHRHSNGIALALLFAMNHALANEFTPELRRARGDACAVASPSMRRIIVRQHRGDAVSHAVRPMGRRRPGTRLRLRAY